MSLGAIFRIPAFIIYTTAGLWGFVLCLGIVFNELGKIAAVLAFFAAPLTMAVAPWFEGLSNDNWLPVILIYDGGITATVLNYIGAVIDGD